jgi:hypothetical protein
LRRRDSRIFFYTTIPLFAVLKIIDEDPGTWGEWEDSGTANNAASSLWRNSGPRGDFRVESLPVTGERKKPVSPSERNSDKLS